MISRLTRLWELLESQTLCAPNLDTESEQVAKLCFEALRTLSTQSTHSPPPQMLPVCAKYLPLLWCEDDQSALMRCLLESATSFPWRTRAHCPASFLEQHANVDIVGPKGIVQSDRVWVGMSLLAPAAQYPEHKHEPAEVYIVLSPGGGEWLVNGVWKHFSRGDVIYNRSGVPHAMRARPHEPLLALWMLPLVPAL